jgi:hypothetical protein
VTVEGSDHGSAGLFEAPSVACSAKLSGCRDGRDYGCLNGLLLPEVGMCFHLTNMSIAVKEVRSTTDM